MATNNPGVWVVCWVEVGWQTKIYLFPRQKFCQFTRGGASYRQASRIAPTVDVEGKVAGHVLARGLKVKKRENGGLEMGTGWWYFNGGLGVEIVQEIGWGEGGETNEDAGASTSVSVVIFAFVMEQVDATEKGGGVKRQVVEGKRGP